MAASEALRNQVTAKWQDSFNRLNRGELGISGLLEFSKVRSSLFVFSRLSRVRLVQKHARVRTRLGRSLLNFYTREIWARHRRISVSVCVTLCVSVKHSFMVADTHEVRSAFDVLMQCRMLPMLLESFVGAFISPRIGRVRI
jgi:hypothetical protein